ncbi:unnamed protein product [Chrysoparadoxa australica]
MQAILALCSLCATMLCLASSSTQQEPQYRPNVISIVVNNGRGEAQIMEILPTEIMDDAASRIGTELGLQPFDIELVLEEAISLSPNYEPLLSGDSAPSYGDEMTMTKLLTELQDMFNYESYLDIGCDEGETFELMKKMMEADNGRALGVREDGDKGATYEMSSDDFFAEYGAQHSITEEKDKFDLVLISGAHELTQVRRDLENSLLWLREGGTILLSRCNPRTLAMAAPFPQPFDASWNGDVFRAVVELRQNPSLNVAVGDFDYGCGVIKVEVNSQPLVVKQLPQHWLKGLVTYDEWAWFKRNRRTLLRLLNKDDLIEFAMLRGAPSR